MVRVFLKDISNYNSNKKFQYFTVQDCNFQFMYLYHTVEKYISDHILLLTRNYYDND